MSLVKASLPKSAVVKRPISQCFVFDWVTDDIFGQEF